MRAHAKRGFTLIEVLIVVGLIVILTGFVSVSLGGRGGQGAALASAQSIVSGLVSATRSQAILNQTNARLLVYAQNPTGGLDNTRYMRALQIVREEQPDTGVWIAVGDVVLLPSPVCVVPPAPVPTTQLAPGVTWSVDTANGPFSTLTRINMTYRGQAGQAPAAQGQYFGSTGAARSVYYLQFGLSGTLTLPAAGVAKIALSPAILSNSEFPRFTNNNTIRGISIRRTGAVTLVDEANGF
ncbi:MAG: type II secretion system protein [Verrucomicrobiota bacterium]